MVRIPFHDLTEFSPLFRDYVEGAPDVLSFFDGNPRNPDDVARKIACVKERAYPRAHLAMILERQNTAFHAGKKTMENIALLRDAGAVAVVTGQQVGLLGGPLYTLYKTITAIKLCQDLRKWHKGTKFVPVFWLETEDHDVAEANRAVVYNEAGAPTALTCDLGEMPEGESRGSVGEIAFGENIEALLTQIEGMLPKNEFSPAVMKLLRKGYRAGRTFGEAFGTLMQALFHEDGLILLDPNDAEVKRLLAPVFRRELESAPRASEAIISQTALLEERYHAQVKARTINLFLRWKGGRYGIDPRRERGDYWLRGTRQYFSRDELLRMTDESPEHFSPNVVLRPICQDHLLPTVIYVGGPGEIAYFAQFRTVYEAYDTPMPIVYPRASVTLLEPRAKGQLDKGGVTLAAFLNDPRAALEAMVKANAAVDLDALLATARANVAGAFDAFGPAAERIDKTLAGSLATGREKALQAVEIFGKKIVDAAVRQNETIVRQAERLRTQLLPNDALQERELTAIPFLARYGIEFLGMLKEGISVDSFSHQVLTLGARQAAQPSLFG